MRQVERGLTPEPLLDITGAVARLTATKKIDSNVYRHPMVVRALKSMYLEKCYLCEATAEGNAHVEHFLPWHPSEPVRAYDWKNLHWSCGSCNQRKRRHPYRVPAKSTEVAVRTDLLDPTAPPVGFTIGDILAYDKDGKARVRARTLPTDVQRIAENTAGFLNDSMLRVQRMERASSMLATAAVESHVQTWRKIRDLSAPDPKSWPPTEVESWMAALDRADAFYTQFLAEDQPFSTCMRAAVFELLRLTWQEFRWMSDLIRRIRNEPQALA